jgi:hypothetical protein
MARRIKIVSDGSSAGTRIYAVDPTGVNEPEPIQRVTAVEWRIEGRDAAKVTLTIHGVEVELEGDEQERPSGD